MNYAKCASFSDVLNSFMNALNSAVTLSRFSSSHCSQLDGLSTDNYKI